MNSTPMLARSSNAPYGANFASIMFSSLSAVLQAPAFSVTEISMSLPLRRTVSLTVSPTWCSSRRPSRRDTSSTDLPSTAVMISPGTIWPSGSILAPRRPAAAAGDPGLTLRMTTPFERAFAVLVRQRAVQRRDDARGQRPVQAERVADGEHLLPDLEVAAGADPQRRRAAVGDGDAQHRQVVHRARADQGRVVVAPVVEAHARPGSVRDDVVVGHDVAALVPHEARTRALRNGEDAAREQIAHARGGGDVNHRALRALEQLDGGFLVGSQVAARGNRARLRRRLLHGGRPHPARRLPGEKAAADEHRKQALEPATGEHGGRATLCCRRGRPGQSPWHPFVFSRGGPARGPPAGAASN